MRLLLSFGDKHVLFPVGYDASPLLKILNDGRAVDREEFGYRATGRYLPAKKPEISLSLVNDDVDQIQAKAKLKPQAAIASHEPDAENGPEDMPEPDTGVVTEL